MAEAIQAAGQTTQAAGTTTTSGADAGAQQATAAAAGAEVKQDAKQDAKGQSATSATTETGKAEAKTAVPEAYTLKLPEGLDAEFVEKTFKPLAKELGLKSDGAQKLVDLYQSAQARLGDQIQQAAKQQNEAWLSELKGDKELGGANYEASHSLAQKTLQRFGGDGLVKFLGELGVASNPDLVRFCVRVGKAISEDTIAGSGRGAATPTDEDRYRAQYPNSPTLFVP